MYKFKKWKRENANKFNGLRYNHGIIYISHMASQIYDRNERVDVFVDKKKNTIKIRKGGDLKFSVNRKYDRVQIYVGVKFGMPEGRYYKDKDNLFKYKKETK